MRLGYLQALRAVMESGTVTEAAQRIGRTQPQVSRLIGALAQELGFELFRRKGRRILPTQEGTQFYEATRHILLGLDDISRVAKDIATGKDAWLKLVAQPFLGYGVLPAAMSKFCLDNPELRVSLEIRSRADVGLWVSGQQFDLGVAALPLQAPGIRAEPFAKVRVALVLPAGHRLAGKRNVDIADLAEEPFIALKPYSALRQHIDDLFAQLGLRLQIRAETSSGASACQLVASGLGVGLADPTIARTFSGLVVKRWKPSLHLTYGFLYPTAYAPSTAALEFGAALKKAIKKASPEEVELL